MKKVAALVAAAAAALVSAVPAEAALRFERCGPYGFTCARLSVPLDRTGAQAGRVSLFVKRIRARGKATRAPLVVLAGGPGQSATAVYDGDALGVLYAAYRNRDLIVFDQRGTGRSGALRCRALEGADLLRAGRQAAACAKRLGPRRAFYTSRDSAEDIDAIRRAVGAPRLALFGTSYGTKVALGYALGHPENVERLVLDSVVEPAGPDALYLDTLAAVPRALAAACGSRCRSFTQDPSADVKELVGRLARAPLRGRLVDSRARVRREAMGSADLFGVLLAGDFDPALRAAFPGAVRSALDGDASPLLRLRRRAVELEALPPSPRLLSAGLYAAATCEEVTLPWPRSTAPDSRRRLALAAQAAAVFPDSAFLPFDRATALDTDILELCRRWPAAVAAPDFGAGPLPDVPVLLLEGEDDLRTPVENARRVAALFPRATLLVAPAIGHSVLGSDRGRCTERAFSRFMLGRSVNARCPAARRPFPATPPAPRRIADVPPLAGVAGLRGRTLNALALTLRDVAEDALTELILDPKDPDLARGGGLRAGRYRLDGRATLSLRGLAYVPGVRLSGRLRDFGLKKQRGRIRVSGPGVAAGTLSLTGARARGSLGGRRVNVRLSPRVTGAEARATAARLSGGPG